MSDTQLKHLIQLKNTYLNLARVSNNDSYKLQGMTCLLKIKAELDARNEVPNNVYCINLFKKVA